MGNTKVQLWPGHWESENKPFHCLLLGRAAIDSGYGMLSFKHHFCCETRLSLQLQFITAFGAEKAGGAGSSSRGQATALAGYRGGDRHGRFGSLLPDPRVTQEKPPCGAVVLRGALGGRFPYFWGPRAGREWVVLPAGRREGGQL